MSVGVISAYDCAATGGVNHDNEPLATEFSLEKALKFIDSAALNWGKRRGCVSCHTNGLYLTIPGDVLKGREASPQVRQLAENYVGSWAKGNRPSITGVISTAAFLAINDSQGGKALHPMTQLALAGIWDKQNEAGFWPDWLKCNWPPYEVDDHYGVTLIAVALGMADGEYSKTPKAVEGLRKMRQYLKKTKPINAHQKGMLLWAAKYHDNIISDLRRTELMRELFKLQCEDGGWASGDLGSWRQGNGNDTNPRATVKTDGYGTGFIIYALRQAGATDADERIQKGIDWLKKNQRASGCWWTQSLRNEKDTPHFLTNAGTVFAIKAITWSLPPEPDGISTITADRNSGQTNDRGR